jgi:hypothetical protein
MRKSLVVKEVTSDIERFRDIFNNNPIEQITDGSWFVKVLQLVLTEHAKKVNAEYFKKKYIGLDSERIALKLIKTSSVYTGIVGGLVAVAISGTALASKNNKKTALVVGAASLLGEIAYVSYLQLTLIYDISILLDGKLDKEDPEDMLTIFWFSLGINIWENLTNTAFFATTQSTAYLTRKLLRSGIRGAIKKSAAQFGGSKLAQMITEKAMMKLIVPGVNVPLAFFTNKKFTTSLGKKAIKTFKVRGVTIGTVEKLFEFDRSYQLLSVPLIYHLGIFDVDEKHASSNIEMQNNVIRRLALCAEEEESINKMIEMEFVDFCAILSNIENNLVKKFLFDIAIYTYLLSGCRNQQKYISVAESLEIDTHTINVDRYKSKIR